MGCRWAAIGLVVAAAAGVAGCGSSSDDEPLSRAEFTQQANAACRAALARIAREPYPRRLDEFRAWGAKVAAVQQQMIDRLGELTPPEETRAAVERLTAGLSTAQSQTEEIAGLVTDQRRLAAASEANNRQSAVNQQTARSLGLTACA